ncbi:PadR family transcriptional regulator [Putridiphycobacter roseus]|uniref:PadR family transcriptional regulator n=1 Tax=Putridiphycobacter roseus TaxID=2219161 RepID=A0A2W1MVP1_9FLAO|nr:PadR family transcriptional regulator [Putridiphycobacter roseus]PZE16169.1 PadR family transcriptional regulator [Putridiphycobacter roseus]
MANSKLLTGTLQTIVLNLLKENGKMYGYEMTQKVKELTHGDFNLTEGALYPTLHKLEAKGLLTVTLLNVENRKRKYYTLTKKGVEERVLLKAELEQFMQSMQVLMNPKIQF